MHTVFEVKRLKPFLHTQNWTLLKHSCKALSTLFNDLSHTQSKIIHKQGAIRILQDSVNNVANFDAE